MTVGWFWLASPICECWVSSGLKVLGLFFSSNLECHCLAQATTILSGTDVVRKPPDTRLLEVTLSCALVFLKCKIVEWLRAWILR